ncbi:Coiled-coil domain-containing protein 12 [Trichoplax sp. H2]|nr:Coiled-coil domain-containing protein 12 [Trichoplax sp. H2]|eukprot:RDD45332.1 Coiled-coil domain-containing protein 12 [Trichoplax sp. H2]
MATEGISSLELAALERKGRLKALAKEKGDSHSNSKDRGEKRQLENTSSNMPRVKFRNYLPQDDSLKDQKMEKPSAPTAQEDVEEILSSTNANTKYEGVDLVNLAPRKPDWDLKRTIEDKMQKLERKTQRSIVDIIRERLREGNLATAVETVTNNAGYEGDSD